MPQVDLPLDQLERYAPPREEPAEFDAFWAQTLAEARSHDLSAAFTPHASPLRTLDVWDVLFAGFGGQPIKGWLLAPRGAQDPLPAVVEYVGYGGGRGHPWDWLLYASAGYAHLVMDTRGQGGTWRRGDTPDVGGDGAPQHPGFLTRGVHNPHAFYYRRLITDAVRAVEAARTCPVIDRTRVAVAGISQGGGLALAVAGLVTGLRAVCADVPFLCHVRRAAMLTDTVPYGEIGRYLRARPEEEARVFQTIGFVDGVNFAARATAPALFSVGLHDAICPPSTVYAAHHHYAGPKTMRVYPYNGHEGGESVQTRERLAFLAQVP